MVGKDQDENPSCHGLCEKDWESKPDHVVKYLFTLLGSSAKIVAVESPHEPALCPYQMKKVRNHTLASQQKRQMLDANQHWVLAVSTKVVDRALRGHYPILSLFLSCEASVLLFLNRSLVENYVGYPIYVAEQHLLQQVIGVSMNKGSSAAALVNVPKTPITKSYYSSNKMRLLILDDVRSAENVGSICRLTFSLGVSHIACSPISFHALNSRSARVSIGALFHLHIFCHSNIQHLLCTLKQNGVVTIGTSPTAPQTLTSLLTLDVCDETSWALVLGNEEEGSSKSTLDLCDFRVCIPQCRGDSFSVVTSAAILLYELSKNRLERLRQDSPMFVPDMS